MLFLRKKKILLNNGNGTNREEYFLEGTDVESKDAIKNAKDIIYKSELKVARNPMFHRKYMKLLRVCYDNLPEEYSNFFKSFEHFRPSIEYEMRNVDYFYSLPVEKEIFNLNKFRSLFNKNETYTIDDINYALKFSYDVVEAPELIIKNKSIAFDKMEQTEFENLYNIALGIVSRLIDVDNEDIKKELENF